MEDKTFEGQDKDGGLRWITITTLLLAIGVILRMVSPSIGGVSLNWNIVMYALAIMLCRPTARQGLGIGCVSGLVAAMTSKAALPYANLVSDPLAAFICAYLARHAYLDIKIGKISIEPALLVFITTLISGGTFVTVTKVILALPSTVYVYVMLPTVLLVALFGLVIGQLLYLPASKIFHSGGGEKGRRSYTLKKINLTIPAGSFSVVTGVNGAGKTTLLLAIAGARTHYFAGFAQSQLLVNGIDILRAERKMLHAQAGMVMADYEGQLVTETVGDEVAFSLENRGVSPEAMIKRCTEVLAMVGLSGLEERQITSLSGGQKQRLAIAAVLAVDLPILVLDEPIAAIDPEGAIEIYQLLQELNTKYHKTIIVAEHDLKYIRDCVDQLIVLDAGELKYAGAMEDCLRFMYEQKVYPEAVPLKWKIRLELGAQKC